MSIKTSRFFTVMIVPEKSSEIKRFVVPGWIVRGGFVVFSFLGILAVMMFVDYWFILGQIDENRDLKIENRRFVHQLQVYKNRVQSVEETMDRIENFANRLRVITNLEERGLISQNLNLTSPPDASENIARAEFNANPESPLLAAISDKDPEKGRLREAQRALDEMFLKLNSETLKVEENLQDLYELLSDQKDFLAALPTRRPTPGDYTSGFGVRRSPFGGDERMHEGLDIANRVGTLIRSTAEGVVGFAGLKPGYGKTVIVDHGYGLETWYAHTSAILVKAGDKIRRGAQIAQMGNTGHSTGPHLHYEIRVNSIPVDPLTYILED